MVLAPLAKGLQGSGLWLAPLAQDLRGSSGPILAMAPLAKGLQGSLLEMAPLALVQRFRFGACIWKDYCPSG